MIHVLSKWLDADIEGSHLMSITDPSSLLACLFDRPFKDLARSGGLIKCQDYRELEKPKKSKLGNTSQKPSDSKTVKSKFRWDA